MAVDTAAPDVVISRDALLKHWQGHRGLTRRVIEAFPDDKLFTFSIGGMRPFAVLVMEFVHMGVPTLRGVITKHWDGEKIEMPGDKAGLLRLWDEATKEIDRLWPTIPRGRFQETDKAFGQWEGTGYTLLLYVIDNEIHPRAQGYVYLRALGVEPPPFYDR